MAIVIDTVLLLQLLNVAESLPGMRTRYAVAQRFASMQQHLFETLIHVHSFVLRQIAKQRGETFLQAHRDIDAFDL